jgi:hypothetical protein
MMIIGILHFAQKVVSTPAIKCKQFNEGCPKHIKFHDLLLLKKLGQ